MGKNISKNISKILNSKYSQKLVDHGKQSATDAFKTRNVRKNISKNIRKILNSKYSQKLVDHGKQSATDAFKTVSNRAIQKTAEATGSLIGNKIADRIRKFSKTSPQNNSKEYIEHDREIHRERYISLEQRQKVIDDLRCLHTF